VQTLAVVNQKGGVWKTTSSVSIAHGLAIGGWHVLLVDLDAQGNVADVLGLEKRDALHRLLIRNETDVVVPTGRDRLDVVLGDRMTADAKRVLAGDPFGIFKLRDALEDYDARYDVCVLDAAPGADILQMGALVACSRFLVPVALSQLAVVGAVDALGMVASLRKHGAFRGVFLGVLPTHWERATKESQLQLEAMTSRFSDMVWPPIPVDTRAREAAREGETLWEYTPGGRAAVGVETETGQRIGGYLQVIKRLIKTLEL
jgi:chromosome partitioning protein